MADAAEKLKIAKEKKEVADKAFKDGNPSGALMSYHQALLYLSGLDKSALQSLGMATTPEPSPDGSSAKEKTEIDEMMEKIHANMSACHMKKGNWKRAIETADKALKLNPNNYKAMFRKGKALGEEGFTEKALKVLEELKNKNPSDAALVDGEMNRLKAIDNERSKAAREKLKGFLNKAEKKSDSTVQNS